MQISIYFEFISTNKYIWKKMSFSFIIYSSFEEKSLWSVDINKLFVVSYLVIYSSIFLSSNVLNDVDDDKETLFYVWRNFLDFPFE